MRVTAENLRERVRRSPAFDVRMELFSNTDETRLIRLSVTSCERSQSIIEQAPEVYDYGSFVFLKTQWTGDEVATLLDQMGRSHTLEIEHFSSVVWDSTKSESHYNLHRVFSGQKHSIRKRKNPFDIYQSTYDINNISEYNAYQSLNSEGLPYFPTLEEAEAFFLFDALLEGMAPSRTQIQVAIDDLRARFERIIVTKYGLKISLLGNELSGCEIKLFGKRPGLIDVVPVLEDSEVYIPLDTMPAELNVYLSLGREVIDQRYIADKPSVFAPTDGITVERDEQTSIEGILLLRGENQHIEFKQQYTENILTTICAFANADGGSVFVGINDEGEILGLQEESVDDARLRIESALADRLRGYVEVNYFPHLISDMNDKIILEIRVAEARDKPVALREKDKEKYYLRRDGTNRIMKRDEWAHMIQTQKAKHNVSQEMNRIW